MLRLQKFSNSIKRILRIRRKKFLAFKTLSEFLQIVATVIFLSGAKSLCMLQFLEELLVKVGILTMPEILCKKRALPMTPQLVLAWMQAYLLLSRMKYDLSKRSLISLERWRLIQVLQYCQSFQILKMQIGMLPA